jgi:hypothetical protein
VRNEDSDGKTRCILVVSSRRPCFMTPRVTADNPTGVTGFDHASIAQLPEHVEASRALDALDRAIRREGDVLEQERWLAVVGAMAAALPYADAAAGTAHRHTLARGSPLR